MRNHFFIRALVCVWVAVIFLSATPAASRIIPKGARKLLPRNIKPKILPSEYFLKSYPNIVAFPTSIREQVNKNLEKQITEVAEATRLFKEQKNPLFIRAYYTPKQLSNELFLSRQNLQRIRLRQDFIKNNISRVLKEVHANFKPITSATDLTDLIPEDKKIIFFGEMLHNESLYRDMFKRIVMQYAAKGEKIIIASEFVYNQKQTEVLNNLHPYVLPKEGKLPNEGFRGLLALQSYADILDLAYKLNIPLIPLEDLEYSIIASNTSLDRKHTEQYAGTNLGMTERNIIFITKIQRAHALHPNAKILVFTGVDHSRSYLTSGLSLPRLIDEKYRSQIFSIELIGGKYNYENLPIAPVLQTLNAAGIFYTTSFTEPDLVKAAGSNMYINIPVADTPLYRQYKNNKQIIKTEEEIRLEGDPVIEYIPPDDLH